MGRIKGKYPTLQKDGSLYSSIRLTSDVAEQFVKDYMRSNQGSMGDYVRYCYLQMKRDDKVDMSESLLKFAQEYNTCLESLKTEITDIIQNSLTSIIEDVLKDSFQGSIASQWVPLLMDSISKEIKKETASVMEGSENIQKMNELSLFMEALCRKASGGILVPDNTVKIMEES